MSKYKYGREINFTLPVATILLNKWQKLHWANKRKHKAEMSKLVAQALKDEGYQALSPFKCCLIEVDRFSAGMADWDGVIGGLKPLLDTLIVKTDKSPHGLGIIEDDNPSCVIESPIVRQHKAKRGEGQTVVTIIEILE